MDFRKDKLSAAADEHEIRYASEQGFFDRSPAVRVLIAAAFILSLFLFLHFREVRVEILELGSIAPKYVVSQVDFEFVDREATLILRQEAVRDIGKIYQISEKQVGQKRYQKETQLLKEEEWRQELEEASFEEMYKALDSLQKAMNQIRFTDPRTLRRMRDAGFDISFYVVYNPTEIFQEVTLPLSVWRELQNLAFTDDEIDQSVREFILTDFQEDKWKLEEDIPSQRSVRKKIESKVPDVYSSVSAGSRIIDQGEKVTERHIEMLQAMKRVMSDKRNLWHPMTLFGSIFLTLIISFVSGAFLKHNHPHLFASNRKLCLLVTIIILTLAISKGLEYYLLVVKSSLLEFIRYPLFVPFAAILTCNLMNAALAIFVTGFLTVVFTMTLPFDHTGFMLINLVASIVAVLSTRSLRHRKEIFVVCGKAWLSCLAVIIAIHFYNSTFWSLTLVADIVSSAIFMLFTAVVVLGLLPLLESGFHIMSDVTLMEYMDPNQELLKRLSFEAPGTYQHTLVVCSLAEVAAVSIGANGLFCRVAALYHDIGKMAMPRFFTENQQGGVNVHQLLTPIESAQTIISHVSEGVAMARKSGLPEQFIDIIKEHHGTTLVYYFYHEEVERKGGDKSLVDASEFRYAGPKPHTKESAIIMIADTFEAASRSLDEFSEEALFELIERLVKEKAEDGQFDECRLTFEELGIVKETMVKTLVAGMHSRVKYPKREE